MQWNQLGNQVFNRSCCLRFSRASLLDSFMQAVGILCSIGIVLNLVLDQTVDESWWTMGRTVASRAIFNWDREMPCSWIDVVLFSLMGCAGFFHAIFQAKLGEKSIGWYFLLFLIFFWGVSLTFRFTKSSLIYITVHYGWYFGIPSFVHSQSLDSKSSCYLVPSLSYLLHSFTIRIYTVPPFGRHYIYSHACSQ